MENRVNADGTACVCGNARNQTEAEVIFVEFEIYDALKETVLAKCPNLKHGQSADA